MINIPSTNDDPAYRYKMPRLASKKEGRGNGSKTCIVNMGEVARALKRPPQYTTKWFGNELGAMSTYTNLASQGERCIINGHHETSVFQESLDNFIAKYVCCQNCKLPEIDMKVKKGMIVGQCLACGWQGNLDNNHKLAVFIAKNPPDASGNNIVVPGEEKGKLDKKARRAEKLARSKAAGEEEGGGEDDASSNESKEDKKDKKKKKDKKVKGSDDEDDSEEKEKKKKKKKDKKDKKADDSDNEDEGKDKKKKKKKDKKAKDSDSEEDAKEKKKKKKKQKEEQNSDSEDDAKEKKKKKKQKEERDADSDDEEKDKKKKKKDKKEKKEKREKSESESEHSSVEEKAKGNGKEDDDEVRDLEYDDPELQSVIEVLKEFAESKGGKPKADDFFEEVRMHQLAKCFDNKVKLYVVFEALCGSTMDAKSMGSQKKYINKIISSASMTTTEVLWTINVYYKVNTGVIKAYPMALKCAYDEEWLQEDELRAYFEENKGAGEPGFENCKKYAAPFLKWLATAGSDDSSSEEESD